MSAEGAPPAVRRGPRLVGAALAGFARLLCGAQARWLAPPPTRQTVFFANHESHLDFVVIWAALPLALRERTRPVAGSDYWEKGRFKRYLASEVFRAVLVERSGAKAGEAKSSAAVDKAREVVLATAAAIGTSDHLILFPEGTRGTGEALGPFKSGLYHLCRERPDLELVPTYLSNLGRVLPKGEFLPLPLLASVTFGEPMRLDPAESKEDFLGRCRAAFDKLEKA